MSSIWPVLHYDNPVTALHFLVDIVGFDEQLIIRDDDGDVVHAEVTWPGGGVLNFGGTKHQGGVHSAMRAGATAVYIVTDNVDLVAERVRDSGLGTIAQPPARAQFGAGAADVYACTIADPEGNLWTFGTYRGAR